MLNLKFNRFAQCCLIALSVNACKKNQETASRALDDRAPARTCIPGSQISYRNASDPNGGTPNHGTSAPGRQNFGYNNSMTGVTLTQQPSGNGSVIFYRPASTAGPVSWIWGADWCYDTATNSISFTRNPIRDTAASIGSEPRPGNEIQNGSILWIGHQLVGTINAWDPTQQESFRGLTVTVTMEGDSSVSGTFVPGPNDRMISLMLESGGPYNYMVSDIVSIVSSEGKTVFARSQ